MSRHEQKPRQSLGKEHSSQTDLGAQPASSLGSTTSRNPNREDSVSPGSTPDASLKASLKSVMPLESSLLYEGSARAIRDAMAAESSRLRNPPSWADLPKIKDLFQPRSEESRRVSLEPVRFPEPGGVRLATPALGRFVESHQSEKPGSDDAAITVVPSPERGSFGREASSRLPNPAERQNSASPDLILSPMLARDRSSQPLHEVGPARLFAGEARFVASLAQDLMSSEAARTPSEMPSSLPTREKNSLINPPGFQSVFSSLSESIGSDAPPPDRSANGDAAGPVVSQAIPTAATDSSSLARLNLSSVSSESFAPFLGDQAGLAVGGRDTNTTALWSSDPSQSIGTQGSFGPVSAPYATSDSASGHGLDLSKTNELLQQLLDEFRKGLQSYLPLTDHNSSTF